MAASNGAIPDKDQLYGRYQKSADWRESLHRRLAHKSLDMQLEDDMNVDNSRHGIQIGWKEMAVIAVTILGGIGLVQFGGLMPSQPVAPVQQTQTPTPVQNPSQYPSPVDSEYEVRFYDADGNLIDIPQRNRK